MKTRFPLYAKILAMLLLNLLFLGAVGYGFLQLEFRAGLDSVWMAQAGERLQTAGKLLADTLQDTPEARWHEVLERFGAAYRTRFFLFRNDGAQAAGEPVSLPEEVRAKVLEPRGMGMALGRRGPPPGRGPNRLAAGTNEWSPPGRGYNRWAALTNAEPTAKFTVRSRHPSGYWMGVCLPSSLSAGSSPLLLLAMSPSLRGGLFPDIALGIGVGLGAVLCSALFWLPLVRGITRSIGQMTQATEQIAEGKFETQAPTTRRDELGRLGQAINRMAVRLSGLVGGQKRFLGDVAHELCSPLARIELALGVLEKQASDSQQESLRDVRDDVHQMSGLVHELLSFSRAALRQQSIELEPVPLAALARDVLSREAAPTGTVRVDIDESVQAQGNPDLLGRALGNLIRNALRYAGGRGPIEVAAALDPAARTVTLSVSDCGPGVPSELLDQIFDPFYRVESSRSRESGGVGLGLAIVKTCVEACRGRVSARNRVPSGLRVEITLTA